MYPSDPIFLRAPLVPSGVMVSLLYLLQLSPNYLEMQKVLAPVVKIMVFSLAPALLLIWSTSPDLWGKIYLSAFLMKGNPTQVLHLPNILPGKATELLLTGKTLVQISTCNNREFSLVAEIQLGRQFRPLTSKSLTFSLFTMTFHQSQITLLDALPGCSLAFC
ncbi:hypothetical protein DSO57_1016977 [Entomophthora muscae]|uniref:Uncharacterized protein n=1 Tax=Entomophthora muscae TaxID=34485 RepID=A0ACC2UQI7_9FUNG|nr:hypothetical protein DSO57_1016977 [Entomophthora muscae]